MLIRYPPHKENYYQEYKGHTKWLRLISNHLAKNIFFDTTLLHAYAQCVYIVCAKYQKVSVKALVLVDFIVYALSKHKQKTLPKCKQEKKNGQFHKAVILPKKCCFFFASNFCMQHANVQCVYIMSAKYQIVSAKAVVQVN